MENENKEQELTEVTEEAEVTEVVEVVEEVAETEETTETEESEEVTENPKPKKKFPGWKLAVSITAMVVVLCLLTGAVLFGMGYRWEDFFPENDVFLKDSYTVSDEKAASAANTVVATVGDQKLTNGMLQMYYWLSVQGFLSNAGLDSSDYNLYVDEPLDQQACSLAQELTWQQYFLETALENWNYFAIMCAMADADTEYVPDAAFLESIEALPDTFAQEAEAAGVSDYSELLKPQFGAGATTEAAICYLTDYYRAVAYETALAQRLTPNEEQLEAYYQENSETLEAQGVGKSAGYTVDVRHILIMPENGTLNDDGYSYTYSDEEWEKCRQKAQDIYDDWLAGEATEETFSAFAQKNSVDGSAANGGLYERVPKGYMVAEFEEWIFDESRQVGDHGLVKTMYGYHIMFFCGSDEVWREAAFNGYINQGMSDAVDAAVAKWPIQINYEKICLGEVTLVGED